MQISSKDDQIAVQDKTSLIEQETLNSVRGYIIAAQKQVYATVNSAMVAAYWNIGRIIYEACGENDCAEYGKKLLQYISKKLEAEFGKGFPREIFRLYASFI